MKPRDRGPSFPRMPRDPMLAIDDLLTEVYWEPRPDGNGIPDEIKLKSYEATPAEIRPYELASLSWEIEGPVEQVSLFLYGDSIVSDTALPTRIPIENSGTQTVSPLVTGRYMLKAEMMGAMKILGEITVGVNADEVDVRSMYSHDIEDGVVNYIHQMFHGISKTTVREDGVAAQVVDGGLEVSIPLEVEINNWRNADADIDLSFDIFANRSRLYTNRLLTELRDVKADISWHWAEHLLSLGITGACQAVADEMLRMMLEDMMAHYLETDLANALMSGVRALLANMGHPGPAYLLYGLSVVSLGIDVFGCPDPRHIS